MLSSTPTSAGSGTNSLHPVSGDQPERVAVTTFLGQRQVRRIAFAKIDVKGFGRSRSEGCEANLWLRADRTSAVRIQLADGC